MKKLIAITAASLLLIAVTGCSGSTSSTPAPDPTYTAPEPTYTAPEPTYSIDDIFVAAVRDEDPYLASGFSDYELIELGSNICVYFDEGGTFTELATYLVANIDATEEAYSFMGFVIGASIAAYCPEYKNSVS